MTEISDDAKRNRVGWTKANAEFTDKSARRAWAAEEITWGVFGVPEASLDTLGEDRLFKRPFPFPTAPRTRQNNGRTTVGYSVRSA